MLKKWSNDDVEFFSYLIVATIPTVLVWIVLAVLYYQGIISINYTPGPHTINIVLFFVCIITAVVAITDVIFTFSMASKTISDHLKTLRDDDTIKYVGPSGKTIVRRFGVLCVFVLIYLAGKGRIW